MHHYWSNQIGNMPKLRYCTQLKSDIETEKYLEINLTRRQRSLVAQLRLGILPLSLATGRYFRIPIEMRYCKTCKQNIIEDPVHFLCECSEYTYERQQLLSNTSISLCKYGSLSAIENFLHIISVKPKQQLA